jgi:hypothetical protein
MIVRFLTRLRKAQLKAATDMLIEIEQKWQFEWDHTERRRRFYEKYRAKLERDIKRYRLMLGYDQDSYA